MFARSSRDIGCVEAGSERAVSRPERCSAVVIVIIVVIVFAVVRVSVVVRSRIVATIVVIGVVGTDVMAGAVRIAWCVICMIGRRVRIVVARRRGTCGQGLVGHRGRTVRRHGVTFMRRLGRRVTRTIRW